MQNFGGFSPGEINVNIVYTPLKKSSIMINSITVEANTDLLTPLHSKKLDVIFAIQCDQSMKEFMLFAIEATKRAVECFIENDKSIKKIAATRQHVVLFGDSIENTDCTTLQIHSELEQFKTFIDKKSIPKTVKSDLRCISEQIKNIAQARDSDVMIFLFTNKVNKFDMEELHNLSLPKIGQNITKLCIVSVTTLSESDRIRLKKRNA